MDYVTSRRLLSGQSCLHDIIKRSAEAGDEANRVVKLLLCERDFFVAGVSKLVAPTPKLFQAVFGTFACRTWFLRTKQLSQDCVTANSIPCLLYTSRCV